MKLSKCIWSKHEITKMPLAVRCTIHLACAPHEPRLMMVRQQSQWDDGALNNPQEDLNLICPLIVVLYLTANQRGRSAATKARVNQVVLYVKMGWALI
jgi:hypothetical protein